MKKNESGNMQSISDQRVLMQCLHVREELSTQFTLIDVTSQRQKKATPPTEERKHTIVHFLSSVGGVALTCNNQCKLLN